jgi:predicted DNA-binding WGR domain protein
MNDRRYFELIGGPVGRFWEIHVEGTRVLTRYGEVGSEGQAMMREARSEEGARLLRRKLIQEKLAKGYAEEARPAPKRPTASGRARPREATRTWSDEAGDEVAAEVAGAVVGAVFDWFGDD